MMTPITRGRIDWCLKKLADPKTKRSMRFECYQIAMSALRDAHDLEVAELDALNSINADPALEVSIG